MSFGGCVKCTIWDAHIYKSAYAGTPGLELPYQFSLRACRKNIHLPRHPSKACDST